MSHQYHVGPLWYLTRITICSCSSSTSTVPCPPLTRTKSPVCRRIVALPQPTTTGIPSSRATMAACDKGVPTKRLCHPPATRWRRCQRVARYMRLSLAWVFTFLHAVCSSASTTALLARALRRRQLFHFSTGGLLHRTDLKDGMTGCLTLKRLQGRVFCGIEV
jgi:hypothetical protein